MDYEVVFGQMLVIVILVCVGIGLYRKKYIDKAMSEKLSAIVINVCNPMLCLTSGLAAEGQAGHKEIATAFVIAILVYAFLLISGFVIPKLCGLPRDTQKFYNLMLVYGNIGFIGIPVAKVVLPEEAMIYVVILNIMFSFVFYTHGVFVMGAKGGFKFKLSPGLVCSILTIVLFWFNLKLPDILTQSANYLGNATTFLSMTILGCSFAMVSVKILLASWKTYLFVLIKMLAIPILMAVILVSVGVKKEIVQAYVLLSAMPSANMPLMLAHQVGEDTRVLTQGILLTTIFTPVTLTVVSIVLSALGC